MCSVAILLIMVSSSVVIADDQYYGRPRKISGGAWLPVHANQQLGKRGRFVFRDAPNPRHYDPFNDFITNDDQDADANMDKRNWRL
jgi:hypothetical protein